MEPVLGRLCPCPRGDEAAPDETQRLKTEKGEKRQNQAAPVSSFTCWVTAGSIFAWAVPAQREPPGVRGGIEEEESSLRSPGTMGKGLGQRGPGRR